MRKNIITALVFLGPLTAFAQTPLDTMVTKVKGWLDLLVPLLLSLAVIVFLWGLVKFISHADDEKELESGKKIMIWGMVAIFVMVSFWGIIGYVQESAGISGTIDSPAAPSVTLIS